MELLSWTTSTGSGKSRCDKDDGRSGVGGGSGSALSNTDKSVARLPKVGLPTGGKEGEA